MAETIEFRGQTYELAPFGPDMIEAMEAWLEARVWKKIEASKAHCSPEEYKDRIDSALRLITGEHCKAGSQALANAAASLAGQRQMLYLQLMPKHPDRAAWLADEIVKTAKEDLIEKARKMMPATTPTAPTTPAA